MIKSVCYHTSTECQFKYRTDSAEWISSNVAHWLSYARGQSHGPSLAGLLPTQTVPPKNMGFFEIRLFVDVRQHHTIKTRTRTYHQYSMTTFKVVVGLNQSVKKEGLKKRCFCFFLFFVPHHWDKNRPVVYKPALHLKAPDLLFSWHVKDLGNFSQCFGSCVLFVAD